MITLLQDLYKQESGQDLIEYGLVALIISLCCLAILPVIGNAINNQFSRVNAGIT